MTADIGKNECGSLPIGIEDFEILRKEGRIYVDKTALIFELAGKPSKIFLPSPPQFGKASSLPHSNLFSKMAWSFLTDWIRLN